MPNEFVTYSDTEVETNHPIRLYSRYVDKVHVMFKYTKEEADAVIKRYLKNPHDLNMMRYNNKNCWPPYARMNLIKDDVNPGRSVFCDMKRRLPKSVTTLEWENGFVSVYSRNNPNLFFSMCGFEVRILPKIRMSPKDVNNTEDGVWNLQNGQTKERTAVAFLRVDDEQMNVFEKSVRQILMLQEQTEFTEIVKKWNTSLIDLITYFREATVHTKELLDLLAKCEYKIQKRIKTMLSPEMLNRFPPVVLYTPRKFGGLGMLSMGDVMIPRSGLSRRRIPNVYHYIHPWEREFTDSQQVWADYALQRHLSLEDLKDSWNRGIPRINTLFEKDRRVLAYDKGWRVRAVFNQYQVAKENHFWWTDQRHDGKLWNLNNYQNDVIQALGGVEDILEHTLFKALMTKEQGIDGNEILRNRFSLWWLPTFNRAKFYVDCSEQMDHTGMWMHWRNPTVEAYLRHIFRGQLWQKIHTSVLEDLLQALKQQVGVLEVQRRSGLQKCYKMNSSSEDLLLVVASDWPMSMPSLLAESEDVFNQPNDTKFWIDVQLRWGDSDSDDIGRYVRGKFMAFTEASRFNYSCPNGLMIGIDLASGLHSAYGNWFSGFKERHNQAMNNILKKNQGLLKLRKRLRKSFGLCSSMSSDNLMELFSEKSWLVGFSCETNHKAGSRKILMKTLKGEAFIFKAMQRILIKKDFEERVRSSSDTPGLLAPWARVRAAQEISLEVQSILADDERPDVIVADRRLADALKGFMVDFPDIQILESELPEIPFRELVRSML